MQDKSISESFQICKKRRRQASEKQVMMEFADASVGIQAIYMEGSRRKSVSTPELCAKDTSKRRKYVFLTFAMI